MTGIILTNKPENYSIDEMTELFFYNKGESRSQRLSGCLLIDIGFMVASLAISLHFQTNSRILDVCYD